MVAAPNDNQVFESACNEQLPVLEESQISRAQEGAFPSIR